MADSQGVGQQNSQVAANQPYDESIEVGDEEEVPSVSSPPPNPQGRSRGDTPPETRMSNPNSDDEFANGDAPPGDMQQGGGGGQAPAPVAAAAAAAGGSAQQRPQKTYGDDEDTSEEDSDDSEEDEDGGAVEGKAPKAPKGHKVKAAAPTADDAQDKPPDPADPADPVDPPDPDAANADVAPPAPPLQLPPPPSAIQQPPPPLPGDPAGGADAPPPSQQPPGGTEEGQRAYDPADYDHLTVTPEIKELFQYITRYTPQNVELDYHFKPFIPDYIPSIGDVDAFLKIPRPDDKPDTLGLTVLDEPCARQSDPTVLDLQLRAVSKQTNLKQMVVKSIPDADKNPKAIENWIKSISDLHKSKPPPNVHYTKNMPDFDKLMQEWPPEFEDLLKEVDLPTADLDCDLSTYVEIVCSLLDIPIYKSKVQSLHVLFTLFSEFKNSQHFRSLASENNLGNAMVTGGGHGMGMGPPDSEDRLVL